MDGDGCVTARYDTACEPRNPDATRDGGLAYTLLDDAIAWMLVHVGAEMIASEMHARVRRPMPPGAPVIVRAAVTERRDRRIVVRAVIACEGDGRIVADARAMFVDAGSRGHDHVAWEHLPASGVGQMGAATSLS
jgi:acyl-coenzyme A thioesterase PaaI-like protein